MYKNEGGRRTTLVIPSHLLPYLTLHLLPKTYNPYHKPETRRNLRAMCLPAWRPHAEKHEPQTEASSLGKAHAPEAWKRMPPFGTDGVSVPERTQRTESAGSPRLPNPERAPSETIATTTASSWAHCHRLSSQTSLRARRARGPHTARATSQNVRAARMHGSAHAFVAGVTLRVGWCLPPRASL